ncbi:MAG: DALR domain-containing protein, partial [Acetivibrio sp.]
EIREANQDEKEILEQMKQLSAKFDTSMEDDFNTADAVSVVFEMVKAANSHLNGKSAKEVLEKVYDKITQLCDILGIKVEKEEEILDAQVDQWIQDRQEARKNRDFKKADAIRDLLLEKNIILEDTREGVRWKRA